MAVNYVYKYLREMMFKLSCKVCVRWQWPLCTLAMRGLYFTWWDIIYLLGTSELREWNIVLVLVSNTTKAANNMMQNIYMRKGKECINSDENANQQGHHPLHSSSIIHHPTHPPLSQHIMQNTPTIIIHYTFLLSIYNSPLFTTTFHSFSWWWSSWPRASPSSAR